jgi:hypothetical protein
LSPSYTNRTKFGEPTMSKFSIALMRASHAADSEATYAREPSRPNSSAPYHMYRTVLRGWMPRCAMTRASSRIIADPEALSLMLGPWGTESRCVPTTTTLLGSVPARSR